MVDLQQIKFGIAPKETTFELVFTAHQAIEEAYSNITSETGKQQVRSFIAQDSELLHVESAVNQQCRLAMVGDSEALGRVSEGMIWWKQLVMREVRKAWNIQQ